MAHQKSPSPTGLEGSVTRLTDAVMTLRESVIEIKTANRFVLWIITAVGSGIGAAILGLFWAVYDLNGTVAEASLSLQPVAELNATVENLTATVDHIQSTRVAN